MSLYLLLVYSLVKGLVYGQLDEIEPELLLLAIELTLEPCLDMYPHLGLGTPHLVALERERALLLVMGLKLYMFPTLLNYCYGWNFITGSCD
jgi:hypothetical protein